jgi:hypothetical protein
VNFYKIASSAFIIIALASIVGCVAPESSGYTPFSHHFKQTKGDSNLYGEYPDHPKYSESSAFLFEMKATDYLEGVTNDLEEIKEKSENARDKIVAVSNAFTYYDGGWFHVSSPGFAVSFSFGSDSNFPSMGYDEFSDWPYMSSPSKPGYYGDQYDWAAYRRELLDLAATADAYIEDGNHYIKNCAIDYETVRLAGLSFIRYLDLLEASNVEIDRGFN